jgi:uroporphyrinogen decarboxylase
MLKHGGRSAAAAAQRRPEQQQQQQQPRPAAAPAAAAAASARRRAAAAPSSRPRAAVEATAPAPSPPSPPSSSSSDPLMVRAARGERVDRPPCWMMRQAGRYQQSYRTLAQRHPSFRQRSETPDLIVEISLQPHLSFAPDGVILFSDILTPLPGIGVGFEIDDHKGPILEDTVRSRERLARLHPLDASKTAFVGEALRTLRSELDGTGAALLGFVGSPWTLATYLVEGGASSLYRTIKGMALSDPELLDELLSKLSDAMAEYMLFQIDAGAQYMQVFDSWGGQLPPSSWDRWSGKFLARMIRRVKTERPDVPLMLYANGSGGLLERMAVTGADVIGLDWTVDMADARVRIAGACVKAGMSRVPAVQGNLDPVVLFAPEGESIDAAVTDVVRKAGAQGHVLNLGHGVLVGTPEESVARVFDLSKRLRYAEMGL